MERFYTSGGEASLDFMYTEEELPSEDIVPNLFFFFSHLQFHVDIQDENDVRVARVSPFT